MQPIDRRNSGDGPFSHSSRSAWSCGGEPKVTFVARDARLIGRKVGRAPFPSFLLLDLRRLDGLARIGSKSNALTHLGTRRRQNKFSDRLVPVLVNI